jgi:threonine synthase
MRFRSTRGHQLVGLEEALLKGIADDGGLFIPDELPHFDIDDFARAGNLVETANVLLRPFFEGSSLEGDLEAILEETLHFRIPAKELRHPRGRAWLLELHHGPTAAFKDVGAGFLAACLSRLNDPSAPPLVILVATSGDTGGAVAAAFDRRPGIRVAVLFPKGRVSERQAKQLTCWSENVLSLEVEGSFDDCQSMVKSAFADAELSRRYRFSSANSINIGRLLPQSTYYAHSSLDHYRATGNRPNYIIPTGNLGNALACIVARDMGLPIGDIVLATNANRIISDFLAGAEWLPRASLQTLATAMDVGNPSNMERLRRLHGEQEALTGIIRAASVSDEQIATQIKRQHDQLGIEICPHTATAFQVYEDLAAQDLDKDWILVSTAHAAKFESIVEPLIGREVEVPAALAAILDRPSRSVTIQPTVRALGDALASGFANHD